MRNPGFTLLEVVLAIGLAGAVLALLTTALDLYLVRVDTSRTQVESAQLARTLLNQIASDLRAVRYDAPAVSRSSSTGSASSSTGSEAGQNDTSGSSGDSPVLGIFGTATELRIDRSAVWQWEYQSILADVSSSQGDLRTVVSQDVFPQTVRYILADGKELLAEEMAASGVAAEALATGYAGLYREQVSTVAWLANPTIAAGNGEVDVENAEFIAPEVVDLAFEYFDGQQFFDQWDSELQGGLPQAIEIRLVLLQERYEQAVTRTSSDRDELRRSPENLTEYRLVVSLANVDESHEAEFPPPFTPNQQSPEP